MSAACRLVLAQQHARAQLVDLEVPQQRLGDSGVEARAELRVEEVVDVVRRRPRPVERHRVVAAAPPQVLLEAAAGR